MGPVPDHRAAERSAEQVIASWGFQLALSLRRRKEVRRLQGIVAEELVQAAMQSIGAALRGTNYHASGRAAVLGRVVISQHAEFADGGDRRVCIDLPEIQTNVLHVSAIEHKAL